MQLTSPEPDGAFYRLEMMRSLMNSSPAGPERPYTPEIPFSDDSKAKAMIIGLTGKPEAVKKKKEEKRG